MAKLSTEEFIHVDNLLFDPQNPRLPSTKSDSNDVTVLTYMLDKGTVTDIMLSIAENGFYAQEPLLVIPSAKQANNYEVVEGNRRLAALKLLLNPDLAPTKKGIVKQIATEARYKPEAVPVLKYNSRDEILLYLGYRHVTGVNEWDSLAKARYIYQLKTNKFQHLGYNAALKAMAKTIGSKANYVHRLLSGYLLYKKIENSDFYNIPGLDEETFGFSLLTTATSYRHIADFIGADANVISEGDAIEVKDDNLKELTEWMFKESSEGYTRLGESRNLKVLNSVVANESALKIFRNGRNLKEAELFTEAPSENFDAALSRAESALRDAWITFPGLEKPRIGTLEKLKEINSLIQTIYSAAHSKIITGNIGDLM